MKERICCQSIDILVNMDRVLLIVITDPHEAVSSTKAQHLDASFAISRDLNRVTLACHRQQLYTACWPSYKRTQDTWSVYGRQGGLRRLGSPRSDRNLVAKPPACAGGGHQRPQVSEGIGLDSLRGIDRLVDCTTDYIHLCGDTALSVRASCWFLRNKPHIATDIKAPQPEKNEAFGMETGEALRGD